MTSCEHPRSHPAAARLSRNFADEGRKWNEREAQEAASGVDLINFSPNMKVK